MYILADQKRLIQYLIRSHLTATSDEISLQFEKKIGPRPKNHVDRDSTIWIYNIEYA